MTKSILAISASAQQQNSLSRHLLAELLAYLDKTEQIGTLVERDLSRNDIALITEQHIGAFYTPKDERSEPQKQLLRQSDDLVAELQAADTLVIATPMYNFSVPASLKAWIDMVCRVGETFRYGDNGPEGLTNIDTAYIVVATGGVPIDSAYDFVVPYLKQVAAFIGVKEVKVVAADGSNSHREQALERARTTITSF